MECSLNCKGYVELEGSKSILARVLIISTFLSKQLKIKNNSNCNDIRTLIDNLKQLGIGFKRQENSLTVFPNESVSDKIQLNINDSGTAFRFLIARLAILQDVHSTIMVSDQLSDLPPFSSSRRSMQLFVILFPPPYSVVGSLIGLVVGHHNILLCHGV